MVLQEVVETRVRSLLARLDADHEGTPVPKKIGEEAEGGREK